jgi:hypothetical protein
MKKLHTLEKVNLREIWKHEAHNFTQWLAMEDNISLLLDEIGVTAENIVSEDSAGKFNVDISADEVGTGKKIVIENQLEKTDHSHLGQLLTYASSFDACIVVWVVAEVREEHKRAIEWFNEHMNDEISFFLVRTEVYRIGKSEPAVKFNVVVEPNTWSKILKMKGTTDKKITDTKINHLNFWEGFKEYSSKTETKLRITRTPKPLHWYDISIGKSWVNLSLTRNSRDKNLGAAIWIGNKNIYNRLFENKNLFESTMGIEVQWNELEKKKSSNVRCVYTCDTDDTNRHDEYYQWLIDASEKLQKAFKKIIK